MGSPQSPTPQQIALLEKAGQLKRIEKLKIQIHSGKTTLRLNIERQAVALVIVEW
jgi:xylan 1,4-beta-xylosidase